MLHDAFHFPAGVDWPIAIYLFLLGISPGHHPVPLLPPREPAASGIIKATAILAPVSVVLGLLILIFPWPALTFWKR